MIMHKGDYTFCGDDKLPHRWALKIKDTLVQLDRKSYDDFVAEGLDKTGVEVPDGQPSSYYVSNDGVQATFWPRADKDDEIVQLL